MPGPDGYGRVVRAFGQLASLACEGRTNADRGVYGEKSADVYKNGAAKIDSISPTRVIFFLGLPLTASLRCSFGINAQPVRIAQRLGIGASQGCVETPGTRSDALYPSDCIQAGRAADAAGGIRKDTPSVVKWHAVSRFRSRVMHSISVRHTEPNCMSLVPTAVTHPPNLPGARSSVAVKLVCAGPRWATI